MLPAEWIENVALISTAQDQTLTPFFFRRKPAFCDNDGLELLADHKKLNFFL